MIHRMTKLPAWTTRRMLFRSIACRTLSAVSSGHRSVTPRGNQNWRKIQNPSLPHSSSFSTESNPIDVIRNSLPHNAELRLDYFGEPVTFQGIKEGDNTTNAMACMDGFLLGVVSKGKSCRGGGQEHGIEMKAVHSSALVWAEMLRHATVWNTSGKSAPMLAVAAVAPLLAQTGVGYVRNLDHLLGQVQPGVEGMKPIQMLSLAQDAVVKKNDPSLNQREKWHLMVLDCLLRHEHSRALLILLKLLRNCPGDLLALSLAMDLSQLLGDKDAALRAVGSVAAYWNERGAAFLRPGLPGHSIATAYMALGFAVGGRYEEAEQLATRMLAKDKKTAGGIATWALAHVYDAQGRTAEGITGFSTFDGSQNYEGSGLFLFDSRLGGYGARFSLDREERGRGVSSALRLYDEHFERVISYSGFSQGKPWKVPLRRAPTTWRSGTSLDKKPPKGEFIQNLLSLGKQKQEEGGGEVVLKKDELPSAHLRNWTPSCEDVLTWLPPTPQHLAEATVMLLRLTLNGTIPTKNFRWDSLRNAWSVMFDLYGEPDDLTASLDFYPLAVVSAALLSEPKHNLDDNVSISRLAKGLHMMGELLKLGDIGAGYEGETAPAKLAREVVAELEPDFWLPGGEEPRKNWKAVLNHLSSAHGMSNDVDDESISTEESLQKFPGWEFDARPFLEHAIVYSACKSGDPESLGLARSICSLGVTLRANNPEEWWRYSVVLGLLGDQVASEDALEASISFGGGQGAKRQF